MPKEQTCLGERVPRSSSKNAKDKSNSAALLASRGRAGMEEEASGRDSRCSSEKDSGYSDTGSDSLQTDLEDQRSSVSEPQGGGRGGGGGAQGGERRGSNAPMPCAAELTPIYIIKNVVLKQPLTVQSAADPLLHGQLTWGGGGHSAQAPAQLLFIQQPGVATPAPLHLLKPQPRKGDGGGKNSKGTYLPILNSYPRIAPHPSKKTPESAKGGGKGCASEGQSLSKRVCTEAVSTTSQVLKQQEGRPHPHANSRAPGATPSHPQHRPSPSLARPRHAQKPASGSSNSRSLGSPSVSSSEMPSPPSPGSPSSSPPEVTPSPGHASRRSASGSSARQRRFLNTVEILNQSGLLDITLRTQELLRQSETTERDIAQLRQHAQLLCQAAQAGVDAPAAWDKLLQAMAESGRYPNLSLTCPTADAPGSRPTPEVEVEAGSGNRRSDIIVTVGLGSRDSEVAPPSPLLAPTPDPPLNYPEEGQLSPTNHTTAPPSNPPTLNQTRAHRVKSPTDIIMPPDSSTHGSLL